jgi:hypothetical protein
MRISLWWHPIKKAYILKAREHQFKVTNMVKVVVRREKRTKKSYKINLDSVYQESRCLKTILG